MAYPKNNCACGRKIGSNVFHRHARKCTAMLREWAKDTSVAMYLLDERSLEEKKREPIDCGASAWGMSTWEWAAKRQPS